MSAFTGNEKPHFMRGDGHESKSSSNVGSLQRTCCTNNIWDRRGGDLLSDRGQSPWLCIARPNFPRLRCWRHRACANSSIWQERDSLRRSYRLVAQWLIRGIHGCWTTKRPSLGVAALYSVGFNVHFDWHRWPRRLLQDSAYQGNPFGLKGRWSHLHSPGPPGYLLQHPLRNDSHLARNPLARGRAVVFSPLLEFGVAAVSLIIGGGIYLLWRPTSLQMFHWFEHVGLLGTVTAARRYASPALAYLPNWFVYSLPNALWFAAGLAVIHAIWGARTTEKTSWALIFCLMALGCEIGQFLNIVPGTY